MLPYRPGTMPFLTRGLSGQYLQPNIMQAGVNRQHNMCLSCRQASNRTQTTSLYTQCLCLCIGYVHHDRPKAVLLLCRHLVALLVTVAGAGCRPIRNDRCRRGVRKAVLPWAWHLNSYLISTGAHASVAIVEDSLPVLTQKSCCGFCRCCCLIQAYLAAVATIAVSTAGLQQSCCHRCHCCCRRCCHRCCCCF